MVKRQVTSVESRDGISVTIPKPSLRYLDLFLTLKCAPDLLNAHVFPNAKEVTESFGAYFAARRLHHPGDPSVGIVVVGDGSTPRTGTLCAFMSKWNVISVDPALQAWKSTLSGRYIDRLQIEPVKIQDWTIHWPGDVVILAVHAHVELPIMLKNIKADGQRSLVSIPCCVKQDLPIAPDDQYENWAIFSPQRTVKVWRSV